MKYHITITDLLNCRTESFVKDANGVEFYINLCEEMPGVYELVSIVPAK
jgi:hypothetical protein